MKIKQTLMHLTAGLLLVMGLTFTTLSTALPVGAECDPATQNCCGGVETSLITCDQTGTGTSVKDTGLWGILLVALNIMTAGVGVAALGGLVFASIMYISAGGSPEQTKKAMGMITNIVIGIIAYAGMYALLNFLVPGGIFN